MRDKSYRRHQHERAVARVAGWMAATHYWCGPTEADMDEVRRRARKRAVHPQSCSSYCCGNPRKWWKQVTRQEQRANLGDRDEY